MVTDYDQQLTIGQAIEFLEKYDPSTPVFYGWGLQSGHSYRGYYDELGLEPKYNVTIGEMLQELKYTLGLTYTGWKGGEYVMCKDTSIWLSQEGFTNDNGEITISKLIKMISSEYIDK